LISLGVSLHLISYYGRKAIAAETQTKIDESIPGAIWAQPLSPFSRKNSSARLPA